MEDELALNHERLRSTVDTSEEERPTGRRRFGKPQAALVVAGLAVVVVLAVVVKGQFASGQSDDAIPTLVRVRRGDIPIRLTEMGEITSKNPIKIAPETNSSYKIKFVIDGGVFVKKGDVLVELDKSDLEPKIADQEMKVESEKAALTTANENYTIQKLNNQTALNDAQLKVELSEIELERYLGTPVSDAAVSALSMASATDFEMLDFSPLFAATGSAEPGEGLIRHFSQTGEAFQKVREGELVVRRAEKELGWAVEDGAAIKELKDKGFASAKELEEAEFEVEEKENALATAMLSRDLLKKYTLLQDVRKKVNDLVKARNDREAAKSKAASQLTQKQVAVGQAKMQLDRAIRKLEEFREELGKMTILAPAPGLVIIGEQRRNRFGSSGADDIKVGATAYPGKTLITLPDFSVMQVAVQVHEVDINRVKIGQEATIALDAYPEVEFHGKVTDIARLAKEESWYSSSEVKVFPVEITIDGEDERLKPGMTAKVEIHVGEATDVAYVPVDAVREQGGAKICLVYVDGKMEPRQVETGVSNESFVEIEEGLAEGDMVALAPDIRQLGMLPELDAEGNATEELKSVANANAGGRPGGGRR